jgi:hypothetical protein
VSLTRCPCTQNNNTLNSFYHLAKNNIIPYHQISVVLWKPLIQYPCTCASDKEGSNHNTSEITTCTHWEKETRGLKQLGNQIIFIIYPGAWPVTLFHWEHIVRITKPYVHPSALTRRSYLHICLVAPVLGPTKQTTQVQVYKVIIT